MSESLQSEATLLLAKVASSGLFTQVFLSSTSSSKSRSDGHPNLERWVLVSEGNASRRMNAQRFIFCFSDFVFPPESYGPISWSPTIVRRRSNPGFIFSADIHTEEMPATVSADGKDRAHSISLAISASPPT